MTMLFIFATFCISFILGLSTGHFKHFPYNIIFYLKNGKIYTPTPDYKGRNYNPENYDAVNVTVTNKTAIYLTYGQSNAGNYGASGYQVQHKVYQFLNNITYRYKDPSLGTTGNFGSVWGRLGDKLIEQGINEEVIFGNCAWGGKTIEKLSSSHYFNFLKTTYDGLMLKYGRVDAILYHQGEADNSPERIKAYYQNFEIFLNNLKKNNITVPVYICRASYCAQKKANKNLTEIQNSIIKNFDNVKPGPDTDTLTDDLYRLEDGCHFSAAGLNKFADMWITCLTNTN